MPIKLYVNRLCTLTFSIMKSFHFQKLASILYMLIVNMEKELRIKVYERIHREFNVTKFKKCFYCSNVSYFQLMDLLNEQYPGCRLYFRVDHVVVKQEGQCLRLFLLCSHLLGKCATFLHR